MKIAKQWSVDLQTTGASKLSCNITYYIIQCSKKGNHELLSPSLSDPAFAILWLHFGTQTYYQLEDKYFIFNSGKFHRSMSSIKVETPPECHENSSKTGLNFCTTTWGWRKNQNFQRLGQNCRTTDLYLWLKVDRDLSSILVEPKNCQVQVSPSFKLSM